MKLGAPLTAKYANYVPEFPAQTRTAAQQRGISFERGVGRRLKVLYKKVEEGPWLYFHTPKRSGICQPDFLVWLSDKHILIVESKLTWVRDARLKLRDFYGPIVSAIYPKAEISFVQLYKSAKKGCHKRTVSIYDLHTIKPNTYKECQWLGL